MCFFRYINGCKLNLIMKFFVNIVSLFLISFLIVGCKNGLPGADARKVPYDPRERVKRNLEQGKGFRLNNLVAKRGGDFEFASSNELWRASLDVIDFMPLASANYSGGLIITDWYSETNNPDESIKVTIRFLTNEIRSDSLDLKIFYKNCDSSNKCKIIEQKGNLSKELKKEILKKASKYQQQAKNKKD